MEEIENPLVEISDYPVRGGKTLRTYDFIFPKFQFILPKFHFILPKFYFAPPWRIFISTEQLRNPSVELKLHQSHECPDVGTHG